MSDYASGGIVYRGDGSDRIEFIPDNGYIIPAREAVRLGLAYMREHYGLLPSEPCPTPTTPA